MKKQGHTQPTLFLLGGSGVMGQAVQTVFAPHFAIVAPPSTSLNAGDLAQVEAALDAARPDLVINAVGFSQEDTAEHIASLMHLNVSLPCFLARKLETGGTPLVFFSSDVVFDGQGPQPYTESSKPCPHSWYARAKAIAEKALFALHDKCYVFRLSRVFGPSRSAPLPINKLIEAHLRGLALQFICDVNKSVTYSLDAAQAILETLDNRPPGLYHIANQGAADMYTFITTLDAFLPGRGGPVHRVTAGQLNVARTCSTLITSEKIPALRPWQQALRDYCRRLACGNPIEPQ